MVDTLVTGHGLQFLVRGGAGGATRGGAHSSEIFVVEGAEELSLEVNFVHPLAERFDADPCAHKGVADVAQAALPLDLSMRRTRRTCQRTG